MELDSRVKAKFGSTWNNTNNMILESSWSHIRLETGLRKKTKDLYFKNGSSEKHFAYRNYD